MEVIRVVACVSGVSPPHAAAWTVCPSHLWFPVLGLLETFVCVRVSVWMHAVSLLEDCLKVEQLGHVVSLPFRYFSFLSAVFCQFDKQVFHVLCQFYP